MSIGKTAVNAETTFVRLLMLARRFERGPLSLFEILEVSGTERTARRDLARLRAAGEPIYYDRDLNLYRRSIGVRSAARAVGVI